MQHLRWFGQGLDRSSGVRFDVGITSSCDDIVSAEPRMQGKVPPITAGLNAIVAWVRDTARTRGHWLVLSQPV
jgi:hypothetical protein